jgi:hypothetical protein
MGYFLKQGAIISKFVIRKDLRKELFLENRKANICVPGYEQCDGIGSSINS